MIPALNVKDGNVENNSQIFIEAKKRISIILGIHALERFLFFSVSIVLPLVLYSKGVITSSDMGLFYLLLFSFYRGMPVIFGYLTSFIKKEKILYISLVLEAFSLVCVSQSEDIVQIYYLACLTGVAGGATTTMILSLLEEENKKCKEVVDNGVEHDIFNIHFMLINAAAFATPFLALLSENLYKKVILITAFLVFFVLMLFIFFNKRCNFKSITKKIPFAMSGDIGFDINFLYVWLASASVWAACSTIYAVIPSLDSNFFGVQGVNIWLSVDSAAVVMLFFIFNKFKIFSKNTSQNAFFGMLIISGGLFLIFLFKSEFLYSAMAIIVVSFGGYIAFPQLYGLAVKTKFNERKALYLGLMAFSGAVGEGCMQALFWITGSANFCLLLSTLLLMVNAFLIKRCFLNPETI
ncbi:hypothetical protein [Dickeya chrysanthemi]|uniref:hypothetical protein n=1 Tax=Dickeya chrysanthemi TaxID=556 RepID=UPI00039AB1C1|nr:hypothetical protein [Dickeya chrysanthemi]